MKKIYLFLLIILSCTLLTSCKPNDNNYSITFFSDGLALVTKYSDNNELKYGYMDKNGNEVIECIYYKAEGFNNGLAIVASNYTTYFLINTKGEKKSIEFTKLKYDYNYNVYYGQTIYKSYLLNDKGETLATFNDKISEFSEGYSVVQDMGKYGYIDVEGNIVDHFKYDMASSFKDGKAIVIDQGNYYIIDKDFNKIFDAGNKTIELYTNNYIYLKYLKNVDGFYEMVNELVDYNNKTITTFEYNNRIGFKDNYYIIDKDVYKLNGKKVLEDVYDFNFIGEFLFVRKDEKSVSFYDKNLKLTDEVKFDFEVNTINDAYDSYRDINYIQVYKDDFKRIYALDKGKFIRKKFLEKYDDVDDIYKDYISVQLDDKYGLISLKGFVKIKPNNKHKYVITDDGYIVFRDNDSNNVVMTKNKRRLIESDDYYYFLFKYNE